LTALAVGACARQQQTYYVMDPNTGQPVPVVSQPSYAQPAYAQAESPANDQGDNRGLFNARQRAPQIYAQPQPTYAQQSYVAQYSAPQYAAPYGYAYASAPANDQPAYTLDSGDKLRVVVFGQDGITNTYTVDAVGNISLPLVGSVPARGASTQKLAQMIAERLKQATSASRMSASRSKLIGRSSSSAKSPIPASTLTSPA
jgi:hypothetical protein